MTMSVKLKVISLNLWMGGLLFDEILQFLKQEDPDLILLQEVYNGHEIALKREHRSFTVLQEKLGYEHSHFAPAFLETIENSEVGVSSQKIEQGNAILSKFPIEAQKTKFYDIPFGDRIDEFEYYSVTPRNLQHVVLNINSAFRLHVLNTQGIWGTHGDDTDRRLKMGDFIVNEVDGKAPLVLAGDFNLNPYTKTVKKIENVLESVFKSSLETSFNLGRKDLEKDPGYATSAVDMMFVSRDIKIISQSCPKVDISDHLPLIVEIEVQ